MRYIGIALVLLSLPAFYVWLRSDRRNYRYAFFAIGLLPFIIGSLNIDASLWHIGGLGYVKGVVVSVLDTLCLAILATMRSVRFRIPLAAMFAAYIAAAMLSILPASGFFPSFSYAFQLTRAFVVFVTVATVVQRADGLRYITYGLAVGAALQGIATPFQRLTGTFQAGGTIGHQNLAGMVLHFATLPLLAMLLSGSKSKLHAAGVAGGLLAVALGASRGSIFSLALGLALLLALSLVRHVSPRKLAAAGLSILMVAAASPLVIAGLETRLQASGGTVLATDGEREAFEDAALSMWRDHPFGVGANQYTLIANTGGYSARAGVTWAGASRLATVHHVYLLTAAELGWFGLFSLSGLLLWTIARGLHFAFTDRRDPRGDLVLGCTCAVMAMSLQSFYEWVFVMPMMQYIFAITLGLISGLIMQREAEKSKRKQEAKLARLNQHAARSASTQPVA